MTEATNATQTAIAAGGKNPKFQRLRAVTLPVLKLEKNTTRYLALLTPMYLGEKLDDSKEAATLIKAVDMETGEFGLIVAPTVLQSELTRNYTNDSYVGKGFEVTVTRQQGKDYNHVTLIEVGIPEEMEATVAQMRREANAAAVTPASGAAIAAAKKAEGRATAKR
jgi:selenophosphate synthase